MRLAVASGIALWFGAALVLSELRWFARPRLVDRLRPYAPGGSAAGPSHHALSVDAIRDVVGPLCRGFGERMARMLGVTEELAVRLERLHSPLDVTGFRLRQVGWSVAGFGVAALVTLSLSPPALVGLVLVVSGPLLVFLVLEQRLATASEAWKRRLFLELPVVAEQMAMLLSAGYSLTAALNRLAVRGTGHAARDLARVCGRIRQGLSEIDALREWATVADVDALQRLVPLLALNREASDLGRLLSE
ncbi:MAG: type II secretion system F family protein, partial [Actinobacteria bacterium]|nr:type II secretion system F family protein [Actinomycetota bacterium]